MDNQVNKIPASAQRRTAIYARMSTDEQDLSIETQVDEFEKFCKQNNHVIVKRYLDHGKSGVVAKGRDAFLQLLEDAQSGNIDFEYLLIYDISRFGRFLDSDEGGHYRYVIKQAGIQIIFLKASFKDDGSPQSRLLKELDAYMAADFIYKLSERTHLGQCFGAKQGFRQGGTAGFGLKRVMIDSRGEKVGELRLGEQKAIKSHRTVLEPGSEDEIRIVNAIYDLFLDGETLSGVARMLNKQGILNEFGRPWTGSTIRNILTNEKYIGHNVFNKTSAKLKTKRKDNPLEEWVINEEAFEPIVDPEKHFIVKGILKERRRTYTDQEMLDRLSDLYKKRGILSAIIIDETDDMPSSGAYSRRFGGLHRAYEMVGFTPPRDMSYLEINRKLRDMHPQIVLDAISKIEEIGGGVERDPVTDLLTINDEFSASLVIARHTQTGAGASRWTIRFDTSLKPNITVALRMNEGNGSVKDYYLLPRHDFTETKIRILESNPAFLDSYRFDTLDFFFELTGRTNILEVA